MQLFENYRKLMANDKAERLDDMANRADAALKSAHQHLMPAFLAKNQNPIAAQSHPPCNGQNPKQDWAKMAPMLKTIWQNLAKNLTQIQKGQSSKEIEETGAQVKNLNPDNGPKMSHLPKANDWAKIATLTQNWLQNRFDPISSQNETVSPISHFADKAQDGNQTLVPPNTAQAFEEALKIASPKQPFKNQSLSFGKNLSLKQLPKVDIAKVKFANDKNLNQQNFAKKTPSQPMFWPFGQSFINNPNLAQNLTPDAQDLANIGPRQATAQNNDTHLPWPMPEPVKGKVLAAQKALNRSKSTILPANPTAALNPLAQRFEPTQKRFDGKNTIMDKDNRPDMRAWQQTAQTTMETAWKNAINRAASEYDDAVMV